MFEDVTPKGAFDRPDERDFFADHILGAEEIVLPEEVKMMTKANHQGSSVKCTTYSTYTVGAILNEIEHHKEIKDNPDKGWELQKKIGTYSKRGDYVQSALKSIVKNGLHTYNDTVYDIDGYARVKHTDIKSWLAKGYPIVTSTRVTKTNYKKAKYDGIWGGKDGDKIGGHAIAIIGYKPYYYYAMNSYGDDWGKFKDGTFLIREEDIRHLGGCYILYDKKDPVKLFKDVTSKSWCFEALEWAKKNQIVKGYGDGSFRPEQPVTRAEIVQMLYNYHNKFNQ